MSRLRQASVVSSDEIGVRIEGSNSYHWVFRCDRALVHIAAPNRGAIVVRTIVDGHRPDVWCSDRYAAQQGHADAQQVCLAHLARDVAYALDISEDFLSMRLKLWLDKALGLARDVRHLAASTRARNQLLTFAHWPGQVEPTNNACEHDLRPAVIQRKITNGHRAMCAAQGEADVRTVVDTARLSPGANIFATISATVGA